MLDLVTQHQNAIPGSVRGSGLQLWRSPALLMFFVVGKHAKKRSRVALVRQCGAPIAELGQDGRFLA
jgi:hypothetical protein